MRRFSASAELLRRYCLPRQSVGAALLLALLLGAALAALPPLLLARTVDALQHSRLSAALLLVALYAGASLVGSLCTSCASYLGSLYREDIARGLRLRIASAVHAARFDDLSKFTTGELTNRLVSDVDLLSNTIQYAILPTFSAVLNLAAMIAAMFTLNVPMAALGVLLLALPAIPPHFFSRRIGEITRATSATRDRLLGAAQDTFTPGALMVLKNARAHEREGRRIFDFAQTIRANNLRSTLLSAALGISANALALLGPTAVLAAGSFLASRGQISVGVLVGFIAYQMRLYTPFASISGLQVQFRTLEVALQRIGSVVDLAPEQSGNLAFKPGDISFDAVTRLGRSGPVLQNLDLAIPLGAHVAVIGRSGAGKSTIASLLLRFVAPDSGRVRIGAHSIEAYDLEELRGGLALVTQDGHIFDETLKYNITYGNAGCSDAQIADAIAVSGLERFVAALPDGLQTVLGPRGFNVSGGERQRIALARTLLMRPQMLILDEALTGVDLRMETAILNALRARMAGRTLIVVTHRVHSVESFDRIFILSGGRIRAGGTHEQLLAADAWYRNVIGSRNGHLLEVPHA